MRGTLKLHKLREYADFVNDNRDQILDNLSQTSIDAYVYLSNRFNACDVSQDLPFQSRFRSFYGLNAARLTEAFTAEYFNVLQALRGTDSLDLRLLVFQFYVIPNAKGQNTLQFSFVTKLAHTINASYPIYDDEVATAFAFNRPAYGSFEHRLNRLMRFYETLKATYMRILNDGLMASTMQAFHARFPEQASHLPNIKLLDFTFWSTGKLIRTKQLTDAPNRVFEPA